MIASLGMVRGSMGGREFRASVEVVLSKLSLFVGLIIPPLLCLFF